MNLAQARVSRDLAGERKLYGGERKLERALGDCVRERRACEHTDRRQDADHEAVAQPHVAVFALPSSPDHANQHDGDERGCGRLEL